jgi:hypothetical protein
MKRSGFPFVRGRRGRVRVRRSPSRAQGLRVAASDEGGALVGEHTLGDHATRSEERERPAQEGDRALAPLVGQQLDVGQAAVVVDADVEVLVAGGGFEAPGAAPE